MSWMEGKIDRTRDGGMDGSGLGLARVTYGLEGADGSVDLQSDVLTLPHIHQTGHNLLVECDMRIMAVLYNEQTHRSQRIAKRAG